MRGKRRRRFLFLFMVMIFCLLPVTAYAAEEDATAESAPQFLDMPDDWSTAALQNAVDNGLLGGVDGKILPGKSLTRAEMATVIVRAFGATVNGDLVGFSDVKESDWFFGSFAKAYQMGVIQGQDGKMNPGSAITREEVFTILARALKLQPASAIDGSFTDADQISDWAKGAVYALVNEGYLQGSNGKLNPKSLITRAQFAQIFDNIFKQYINKAGVVTAVVPGNIMVNVPGVTLQDLTIDGDLIIGDGVGDGEVILDNVTVTGRMVIRGGGENSIIIRGTSSVTNVIISRVDGKVSVKVEGDADVEIIYIDDGSDDVNIEGTVGNVEVQAADIVVNAVGATITSLDISGENAKIVVDANSTVGTVKVQGSAANTQLQVAGTVNSVTTAAAGTSVSGSGTVTKVEAQAGADNTKIETPSTQIVVGAGVSGVTGAGGTAVSGGTTVNNNTSGSGTEEPTAPPSGDGGGGGSGDRVKIGITNISVVDRTTVTFHSDVSRAEIIWNGAVVKDAEGNNQLTKVGSNTITVPLMTSKYAPTANTLTVQRTNYITYTNTGVLSFAAPYDETASLPAAANWVTDRTEPKSWEEADDWITLTTEAEPSNNWYAWQGRKAETGVGLTSDWIFETQLRITDEMLVAPASAADNISTSVWLQVEGSENFRVNQDGVIDWAILQFKKDFVTNTAGWQAWNSTTGVWVDLSSVIPTTPGTYTLTMIYSGGTLYQYIEGMLVNHYDINVDEGISSPTNIILQSYSFGKEYSVDWKLPTVRYAEQIPFDATIVSTAEQLRTAVTNAPTEGGYTVYLTAGTYNLTAQLNISRPLALIGLGEVTIKAGGPTWPTGSSTKHLLDIYPATSGGHETHIANITFDSSGIAYGLQVYGSFYATAPTDSVYPYDASFDEVTMINSKGAGLTVNGARVLANSLITENNAWGAINVDPGSGIITPSIFTLTFNGPGGELKERKQIWSDGANTHLDVAPNATVTVNAAGYTVYPVTETGRPYYTVWNNKTYGPYTARNEGGTPTTYYYETIQDAVNLAEDGDTLNITAGEYTETGEIDVTKELTINGQNYWDGDEYVENTFVKVVPASGDTHCEMIFDVGSSNVTISGLTLDRNETSLTGIMFWGVDDGRVSDCKVIGRRYIPEDFNNCIFALGAANFCENITFENNIVEGVVNVEEYDDPAGYYYDGGIGAMWSADDIVIRENHIDGLASIGGNTGGNGITCLAIGNVTIEDNEITGCYAGIYQNQIDIIVEKNEISENKYGIWCDWLDELHNNSIHDNQINLRNNEKEVDATGNFWGVTDYASITAKLDGNIMVFPWALDETKDGDGNYTNLCPIVVDSDWAGLAAYPDPASEVETDIDNDGTNETYQIGINAFGTLEEAISAASDGNTILVKSGTYDVNSVIYINKNLTIVGEEEVVFESAGSNSILVPSNGAKLIISDVEFKGTKVGQQRGIEMVANTEVIATDCIFDTLIGGIYANPGAKINVSGSTFRNVVAAIGTDTAAGNLTITGNTFEDSCEEAVGFTAPNDTEANFDALKAGIIANNTGATEDNVKSYGEFGEE